MTMLRRFASHSALAVAEAGLIALLVVGLIAGTAFAGGKGTPTTTASTMKVVMVADANGNKAPNRADTITFEVTTSVSKPWIALNCYQGSDWVYTASAGFFPTYAWPANFTLSSSTWTSGGADCTAKLYYVTSNGRNKTLATMSVPIAP